MSEKKISYKKRQLRRDNLTGTLFSLGIVASVAVAYEIATDITGALDPLLFPGLSRIVPELAHSSGKLLKGTISSAALLVPGYGLALFLGISLGLITGMNRSLKMALMPLFRALSPIPSTMLIPYAIAVLPTFWLSSAFIIFAGAFWPILLGTIHGVILMEPRWIDNARCLGLKGPRLIFKVVLPGAMPTIFAGAGMALVFSFILLTVAEMFGAKSGLGFFIQYYADFADYPKVLAGMLFMAAIIITIMGSFDWIQARVLHWTKNR